ncbi:MAG: quinone oxidoreductase [Deltaproteobacteria bacterium]|nr:quinone oxidoreductase [Deltaproteobacteria bacterium]MCZ6907778.1 quinone oxidoreductase [Deltaproteobacteria bacterium]
MKAIRVHQTGGPEVMKYEEVPLPEPGAGEARVKLEAIGLNFIDTYQRSGIYPFQVPFSPGMEGAGIVDAVGEKVTEVKKGDRVAYAMAPGSYRDYALVPSSKLVPLPQGLDIRSAAAVMLQGMTAHYLSHSTYRLKKGVTALVHAAAGGVGLLLIQIAKRLGATVFGTVSTEEKARLAKQAGADDVILYTQTDFLAEVRRLTNGKGVEVVYDSVGQSTFDKSLDCLSPRGYLVLFGQSSGPVPPLNVGTLAAKGSLYVTRPTLANYANNREELLERSGDLFNWLAAGELKLRIDKTFPLSEAAEAHRQLEGRKTTGKVLLIP